MMGTKEKTIKDFTDKELDAEIEIRGLMKRKACIKDFDDHEIMNEVESRGLDSCFESDLNDYDKNKVLKTFYNDFTWMEMNAMFKQAMKLKNAGQKVPQDYSFLEGEVIS